jgi:hypothetical protein
MKTCVASERYDLETSHERDDGLRFALQPRQASGDSSEVGTIDVPTSVCSIQTVWATDSFDFIYFYFTFI